MAVLALTIAAVPAFIQLTPPGIVDGVHWEEFLRTAEIVAETQLGGADAVTHPWKLTLEKDGRRAFGLWKSIDSREGGDLDCWRYEIAAYRIDLLVRLNMVPPTVERPFKDKPGSLQLWVEGTASLKSLGRRIPERTPDQAGEWNRHAYLQRVFDDLIANEDRNANNILVTPDGRVILIDHSRSFRVSRRFTRNLIFGPGGLINAPDGGPYLFKTLPRTFYENIRTLDAARVRETVGTYLTDGEIEAILARKTLVLREIESMIARNGEDKVLYR
jgi:hypothetical protein